VSRLPQLEELAIGMAHPSSGDGDIRLRFSLQSLRLLDARGMPKLCYVGFLACPALEELRTLWHGHYSGGIMPWRKGSTEFYAIGGGMGSDIPHSCCAFGARGHHSPAQPVDISDRCRVIFYTDDWPSLQPRQSAVFGQRVNDDGSRSWTMLEAGA